MLVISTESGMIYGREVVTFEINEPTYFECIQLTDRQRQFDFEQRHRGEEDWIFSSDWIEPSPA